MTINSERIDFIGYDGKSRLAARLDRPSDAARASAIFAHCFTCSKDILAASRIARALAERGFAVLRFDFTGLGASQGEFANTNFTSNVQDLVAAARFMEGQLGHGPELLVGHSLGGAAVLAAAHDIPAARAVATIGAPAGPAHLAHLFRDKTQEIEEKGEARVDIAGRTFTVQKHFLEDIEDAKIHDNLATLRKALLILHGPRDTVVGIDNAAILFEAAKHPKSFISLDDADHLLTRPDDAIYVADVLAAWAGRYIDAPHPEAAAAEPQDAEVVVAEAGSGGFAQTVRAGRHRLTADEPERAGGTDTGPSPYDLLLAALGACTSMTLRMYAGRKDWPLDKVTVALDHGKVHSKDCEDCEDKDTKVDRIERRIALEGPLDAEQRARLLEIANKCPVHRTLTGKVEIVTDLEGPG